MHRFISLCFVAGAMTPLHAQQLLSLDSCRAMALRNNKQISVSRLKQDVAHYTRKAAKTKYLPKVDAIGGYELMSKEISLLNNEQKTALNNLGTNVMAKASDGISSTLTSLAQQGVITSQQAQVLGNMAGEMATPIAQSLNEAGSNLRKAFRTNNRNLFGAAIIVRQPIYMGGAITAANRIAAITEAMTSHATDETIQNTLYSVDEAYWLCVSLKQKNILAQNFLELVKKLEQDIQKMIREGFATKADGLKVSVKVNEAEMTLSQAEDGLALSKMLLCQLCGLPINSEITLADENTNELVLSTSSVSNPTETAMQNRPELKMLADAIEISEQGTHMARAAYLPQVALTGGYMVTNPNVYNGYENKFGGVWSIGIMVRIPVWNWQEGVYKVRASKATTSIANMELAEAKEMIELQVNQNRFKMSEANKRYTMSLKNVEKAEENLRCANLGFHEGVMTATEVMEAQTAWLQAQTQKIESEIDIRLTEVGLKKSLGILN